MLDEGDADVHLTRGHVDQRHDVLDLLVVQARARLVDQHELGVGKQGADDFQHLLLAIGQRSHVVVRVKGKVQVTHVLFQLFFIAALTAEEALEIAVLRAQVAADEQVVADVAAREEARRLKRSAYTHARTCIGRHVGDVLAVKEDLAGIDAVDAADEVEHRALAGAVRADEAADHARLDGEAHVIGRYDAAEALAHAIESQKILTHLETSFTAVPFVNLRTSFFHRSPTAPARPMGMKIIITITAKP